MKLNASKSLVIALLAMLPLAVVANPVTPQVAEQVARNFWNQHHDKEVTEQLTPMQQLAVRWDAFYIFAPTETEGFVIVAADDAVQPVLAYSFHNSAMHDSVGRDMSWWLDGWQQQIDFCRNRRLSATDDVAEAWNQLMNGTGIPRPLTVVAPMVTTQWDQDAPYNDSCPSRSGWGGYTMHAATGCVATAMAQVMRYWSYPEHGTGSHSYYSQSISQWGQGFGQQTVNFGATTYDWANMPNTLTYSSSAAEKAAVATLMYHCGVACDMMYGTAYEGGSGAFIHSIPLLSYGHTLNGMVQFFGYSSNATGINRDHYSDSAWTAMVLAELDAGRPIVYAGGDETSGGHCFVCSGYDDEGRFHFNWGWSGSGDGYYLLSHLAPGTGGTGGGTGTYDFTNDQQMLVGIQPPVADDTLCIIRHFPYTQDFNTAPTCWSATTTSDYSYSWMVYDTTGADGNYSALITPPLYGSSSDHLLSPYIITPGRYTLTWQIRTLDATRPASYSLTIDTLLLSDTVLAADWTTREVTFTVVEGDTVQLDFAYSGRNSSVSMMIDNITIVSAPPAPPVGIEEFSAPQFTVYPNPTNGMITIRTDWEIQRVEVLDMMGRHIECVNVGTIDLSHLPDGIYLLRCTSANSASCQRIIKRR